jgi:hypothetical protein
LRVVSQRGSQQCHTRRATPVTDAQTHLLAALDDVPQHDQHQPARPQAAEMAVAFHDGHLGAGPFGRDGRDHAGRPAAHDEHVGLMEHGQFAARLDDFAVDQSRARCGGLNHLRLHHAALKATGPRWSLCAPHVAGCDQPAEARGRARGAQQAEKFSARNRSTHRLSSQDSLKLIDAKHHRVYSPRSITATSSLKSL